MEAPRVGEHGLGTFRQLSQLEVADTSNLRTRQPLGATGALDHATIDEDLLAQVTRRPVDGLATDRNGVEPNVPPP
jgi:hypothetical protein